ncbi:MAG: helical backbone metal receptor [Candidatus Cloacimonetes bacterium]|nr:helical backbone metal receptor [Candidatus Cloacimonadota bacterium]
MNGKCGYFFWLLLAALLLSNCTKPPKADSSNLKLVITSPEVAEIVYQLQGEKNIAGVTMECNYPVELQKIFRVGTFGGIDMEKVAGLQPDVIFVSGLEQNFLAAELQKLAFRVEKVYPASLAEMLRSIGEIAKVIGAEQVGKELTDSLSAVIEHLRETMPEQRPSIYVEIYGDPIMSVADDSYVGELVELAGFDNIFAGLPRDYSRVSPEAVLAADPDYILLLYPGMNSEQVESRKGWGQVSAVLHQHIYNSEDIDPDLLLRATPRSLEGVKLLRELIEERNE